MNLFLLPQWLCISTWRFFKLFTESLRLFPWRFSSIPRFVLVALLSVFALLISYLHLCVVFVEHIFFALIPLKPYPIVFIVGPPRSGTTRMHKLMAGDCKMFSSMKMWELFFAPATSQKLLLLGLGKLDELFGAPFFRLIQFIEKKAFKNFNRIHELGLFNVEEDALVLFHLFSSYHMSFLLGKEQSYEHLNYNKGVPKAVWSYYKICVDNHMRLNPTKTYLSKNPFFSGSAESLITLFKAPKFVYMLRDINQVAPSFFSLKKFLTHFFYGKQPSEKRYKYIFKTLLFWREAPKKEVYKSETIKAEFTELAEDPVGLIKRIYRFMELELGSEYKEQLKQEAQATKNYKSEHKYSTDFDLNALNKG